MTGFFESIRRIARFVFSTIIWLHALLLLNVSFPSLHPFATKLHLNVGELTVLALIISGSLLLCYGWAKITVDLLYVYFFLFICLYLFGRLCFFAMKQFNRLFDLFTRADKPSGALILDSPKLDNNSLASRQTRPVWSAKTAAKELSRPFRQFTLFWCVLLLLTAHTSLLWLALLIVLIHLVYRIVLIMALAVFSINGLSQLEGKIKKYAEDVIVKVMSYSERPEPNDEVRNAWMSLSALQIGVAVVENRRRVAQWIMFLSVIAFLVLYTYIGVLFGFAYYGMARVAGVTYSWADAFVTSLFIPFMLGDLPHVTWIRFVGGLHATFAVLLGIGTIFGYLQKKLNSLYTAAEFVKTKFEAKEVKDRIATLNEVFKTAIPPTPTVTHPSGSK